MVLRLKVKNTLHWEKNAHLILQTISGGARNPPYLSVLYFPDHSHMHFIFDPYTGPCWADITLRLIVRGY